MNISAVTVLIAMPMAATIITNPVLIGWGSSRRRIASSEIAPKATSSSAALASAANIELDFSPYVNRAEGGLAASTVALHAISRPNTSDKLCPASATSAIDPANKP